MLAALDPWRLAFELYRLTLPNEPKELTPGCNVAPTHVMPIVRPAGSGRELVVARWGLVFFRLKGGALECQARHGLQ